VYYIKLHVISNQARIHDFWFGGMDLEFVLGVTKKVTKLIFPSAPHPHPLVDFTGGAKWIFRILRVKNKKWY